VLLQIKVPGQRYTETSTIEFHPNWNKGYDIQITSICSFMSYLAVSFVDKGKKMNSLRPRKGVWWSRLIFPLIPNLDIGWRWLVNIKNRTLKSPGNNPQLYPL